MCICTFLILLHILITVAHFPWQVFEPALPYQHTGAFLNFQLYNVEARDRVKCISARDSEWGGLWLFVLKTLKRNKNLN